MQGTAQSTAYSPKLALEFFRATGTVEVKPAAKPIFSENEKSGGFFSKGARIHAGHARLAQPRRSLRRFLPALAEPDRIGRDRCNAREELLELLVRHACHRVLVGREPAADGLPVFRLQVLGGKR